MFILYPFLVLFPFFSLFGDPMNENELTDWLETRNATSEVKNITSKVVCTRTKLKKNSLDGVRKWFQTLKERKEELLAFTEEGISLESVFIEKIGDDHFLIFYARSDDFEKTYEAIKKAMLPITVYHYNCWQTYCEEESELLELVFDLERNNAS